MNHSTDKAKPVYQRIYHCVSLIPRAKVATYGQIAKLIAASGARQVGYALSSTPTDIHIPWHRVINAKGQISPRSHADAGEGEGANLQQQRLLEEGIVTKQNGCIKLEQYRWQPNPEEIMSIQTFGGDEQTISEPDLPGYG